MAEAPLQEATSRLEPPEVVEARRLIDCWQKRHGHDSYVEPLGGGYTGYQGRCWDCDWHGPEHLRGDEEMGTPESRQHKKAAYGDAAGHQLATKPDDWKNP